MFVAVNVVEFFGVVFSKFIKKSLDDIDGKPSVKAADRKCCLFPGGTDKCDVVAHLSGQAIFLNVFMKGFKHLRVVMIFDYSVDRFEV